MADYKPTPRCSGTPRVIAVRQKSVFVVASPISTCNQCGQPKDPQSPGGLCRACRRRDNRAKVELAKKLVEPSEPGRRSAKVHRRLLLAHLEEVEWKREVEEMVAEISTGKVIQ